MFHTKFGENWSRPLIFKLIWIFEFFLSWYQILKFRCIHEASSVRKPKPHNILSRRKNFVKSVKNQYGNPDSHAFFEFLPVLPVLPENIDFRLLWIPFCGIQATKCWCKWIQVCTSWNVIIRLPISDADFVCDIFSWILVLSFIEINVFFDTFKWIKIPINKINIKHK